MKLSIIIPYYNTKTFTLKLLDVLVPQLTNEVEVILVDDGCFEKDFKSYPIKVVQIQNRGVSKARNVGLENSSGIFVTFVDSDDLVSDRYISTILEAIDNKQFDYCYFGWRSIRGDVEILGDPPSWNTAVWNCIYKRPTAKFDENKQIAEEIDFNRQTRVGKKENINKVLYIYNNQREDSLTKRYCKGEIKIERGIRSQIVVYRSFLSVLGGIETAIYNFCHELHKDYDITFVYDTADQFQLFRLKKLVNCVQYQNQPIECDKFVFYGFNPEKILSTVKAKEIIQQVCCDVKAIKISPKLHPRVTKVFADSKASAHVMNETYPKSKCGVLHNIFTGGEHKRVLHLMTASRLSWEKGYERMKRMAKRMHELKIPFTWEVFTNDKPDEEIDGFVFRKPRLNVRDYISGKDYGIQLSETESWCCTATEFLLASVPMVLTDFPSAFEQVKDGKNGFILNRDLTNLDLTIQKMYETKFSDYLDYTIQSKQEWRKVLGGGQTSDYKYEGKGDCFVKAIRNYYDTVLERHVATGDVFEVTRDRAEVLLGKNGSNVKFAEIME